MGKAGGKSRNDPAAVITILYSYKKIIEYAKENNIQIRGSFQEVYNNDKIDIYVEAYDLNQENDDELAHRMYLDKHVANVHPKDFIGKWKLMGEIIEPPYLFNPKKIHTKIDLSLIHI